MIIKTLKGIEILVDDEDFEYLNQWKWYATESGYAYRKTRKDGKYETIYMHKQISNVTQGQMVDHINRNKLDNRKCNLRLATPYQNTINSPPRNGRKYKGVYKYRNKWAVRMRINDKFETLAILDTEDEAAIEYNTYAYIYHGKWAYFNKVIK
jgi:hypothetical protein